VDATAAGASTPAEPKNHGGHKERSGGSEKSVDSSFTQAKLASLFTL